MGCLFYIYGWIFVRPRRWLFGRMLLGSFGLRLMPEKRCYGWSYPNLHWWILYHTIFNFFCWLYWDAWRPFCKWDGVLIHKPLIAKIIHRIGATTAGFAINGFECFHCGCPEGCQVELSNDESGQFFKLKDKWSVVTINGTDHRFSGTTICPKCGYQGYYEDGSL